MRAQLMRRAILLIPFVISGVGGCYDGQVIAERISQRVSDDHREEIDLGVYQVTLPRQSDDPVQAVTAATTLGARVVRMTQTTVDAAVVEARFTELEHRVEEGVSRAVEAIATTAEQYLDPDKGTLREMLDEVEKSLGATFDPTSKASVLAKFEALLTGGGGDRDRERRRAELGRIGTVGPARECVDLLAQPADMLRSAVELEGDADLEATGDWAGDAQVEVAVRNDGQAGPVGIGDVHG